MEDGLRVASSYFTTVTADSLNPYSCGRWSQSGKKAMFTESEKDVLILFLVEDGLREYHKHQDGTQKYVLILVVVEDGLRGYQIGGHNPLERCLNPCCCGRWSQRFITLNLLIISLLVLILVVVEDGLRAENKSHFPKLRIVLILVVVEDGLRV